ncbi:MULTISPECIES: Mu-like prophage major head subunit gpT family protein [unclassified Psychrobacter]|uniref:Mu-like prophage major head subunit gpT family protein n=1 Tax=unclassified Psychrobacter TaxID=196806 RepID=UPI0018F651F5|nr:MULTISPECIES: Mu-like prophage major head subunit gpT family protein [unclassified Psychrobacter]
MNVNGQTLNAIAAGLKKVYNDTFNQTESYYKKVAMVVPSTNSQETYAWLSKFPRMQKWIGDKVIHKLSKQGYSIVNNDFEVTVEVKRNDIEDDNIGQYNNMSQQAGWSAAQLPDELVAELINKGHENTCYDGKAFFSTQHPVTVKDKETKVSNLLNKALSAASAEAAKASYGTARTLMRSYKDESGRSLKVKPNLLIVGTDLEDTARTLLTADKLENGDQNIYKGTAELLVIDDIATGEWYLEDTTMPVKALIVQERKKPVFVSQTDMNAPDVFMRAAYKFGAEARYGAGYGFWQLMLKGYA